MAVGSSQFRVKMSTRNIPGGKGGRCLRLTTLPPSRAECHEIWEPKPPGTSGPHRACNGTTFPLPLSYHFPPGVNPITVNKYAISYQNGVLSKHFHVGSAGF
jgi:hypothetical protein